MKSATPSEYLPFDGYRIQSHNEPLETLFDDNRKDGWVASDELEDYEKGAQPKGISATVTLSDLSRYMRKYSMNVRPQDYLVGMTSRSHGETGMDRDEHAIRISVDEFQVLGTGEVFADAAEFFMDNSPGPEWDDDDYESYGLDLTDEHDAALINLVRRMARGE